MSELRAEFIKQLTELPNITLDFWKDTPLLCVFHNGKEIAHFQGNKPTDTEIDIRLTQTFIKQKGLQPPVNTSSHLDRSKNSRWIVQSFAARESFDECVKLIKLASKL